MRKLTDKHGFSYIFVCILTLFISMLLAVGLEYTTVLNVVQVQKRQMQQQMDSAVTEKAIDYYNAIKQGSRYNRYIEESNLEDQALRNMGFGSYATENIRIELDGELISVMTRPTVNASIDDGFGIHAEYVLSVPFRVFGQYITDISSHVHLDSYYKLK